VIDWADDVTAVAHALGMGRFSVFGWSAGAPHALACAYRLPDRVAAVALASPMGGWLVGPGGDVSQAGPETRRLARLGQIAPWALPALLSGLARRARRNPRRVVDAERRSLPAADQAVVADQAVHAMLVGTLGEAFRQGAAGLAGDVLACARPWGFDPAGVSVPTYLWHGLDDRTIPVGWARRLADAVPGCQASWLSAAGHFLLFPHWATILSTITPAI
jgi:pimeloyl-ACP methyl ester carboxylesterase